MKNENQELKEKINNIKKIIIDNSYNELYEWFDELREENVIEIVNILDIKKDIEKKEVKKMDSLIKANTKLLDEKKILINDNKNLEKDIRKLIEIIIKKHIEIDQEIEEIIEKYKEK